MSFKYFDYPGKNRRPSPKEIGAKLHLDERTVRLRTAKMEKEGFIQYYQTVPNMWLLGNPLASLYNFQATSITAKRDALQKARDEDDVIDIADFLGVGFGLTISAPTEQQAIEKAKKIAQHIGIETFQANPPRQFPQPRKSLDKLDWQIIKALRYHALRPTKRIAEELKITYRMAEYTIGKLFESRALSTRAIINASEPKGIIFYSLNLRLDEKLRHRVIHNLREIYGKRIWWHFSPPGHTVTLFLFATSIARAEDDLIEALSKTGVLDGSMTIFKGWVEPRRPSWIDRRVQQMIGSRPE